MALNLATLKTRSLTAIIFVVVMLGGLLWSHWTFFILFSIIHFGCWSEYQKLIGKIDPEYNHITPLHKYGVRIAGWCIVLFFTNNAYNIGDFSLHAVGWWVGLICVFMLPIIELLFAGNIRLKNIWLSALGLIYISLAWGLMIDLRCVSMLYQGDAVVMDLGPIIPCGLIFSIWINDTMAYIVGSLIGKRLSLRSPPKRPGKVPLEGPYSVWR